ncbi:MAG: alpha-1,4-glucan--maltose-1-phosphate maltosyltransferase [Acidimicrobiales bacterium]|nr:alpha-1,4-glucan--maltose-1-phosphate maltosyltransferase [Acidimicrobiales bacterium]
MLGRRASLRTATAKTVDQGQEWRSDGAMAPSAAPEPTPEVVPPATGRVVVEGVTPTVDGGRFPVKRVVGERVVVEADVYADGHDQVACELSYRRDGEDDVHTVAMAPLGNDRWRGAFTVTELGRYRYCVRGWVDHFASWHQDYRKKQAAGTLDAADRQVGARLVREAIQGADDADRRALEKGAAALEEGAAGPQLPGAGEEALERLMARHPDRRGAVTSEPELEVVVDPVVAGFSAWYELFPRSASPVPDRPGTLADVEARLEYVAGLGFDVLYLPPIHPIGRTGRKGPDNSPVAAPGDPGSPWAIGSAEGGHTAIHPELGTLADFDRLVGRARQHGIELALDLAFQCSPDHPWVTEHPGWFRHRPDGTIQCAENPPKRYEDIYPLDFETSDWWALWLALLDVVLFWVGHGVRLFRVDNPHTKPFPFWSWLIGEVKARHPEVVFLSEAFTRPKIMYRLAKLGFGQSYTYFTWRLDKWDLTSYLTELTQTEVSQFFRPNLWPNTPDILTEQLQTGGRPTFMARLVLAATLGANYGIFGPSFELVEHEPLVPGREDYRRSEKYEIRHWDLDREDSLASLVARLNRIRRDNPALQRQQTLRFHHVDNDQLIAYTKTFTPLPGPLETGPLETGPGDAGPPREDNIVLVVVNLDPVHPQSGWVQLDLDALDLDPGQPFQVHDLLTDARYRWQGSHNFVLLEPWVVPAHVFRVSRRVRTERDFEYYM